MATTADSAKVQMTRETESSAMVNHVRENSVMRSRLTCDIVLELAAVHLGDLDDTYYCRARENVSLDSTTVLFLRRGRTHD
jgi:predicted hydrolase (HD superfamily)